MRAFPSDGQVGLEATMAELPEPGMPGPGDIRVRMHATSINFDDPASCELAWLEFQPDSGLREGRPFRSNRSASGAPK